VARTEEDVDMPLLQGKAVVLTGSGHGIGAACAKGVARQGGAVVINDINQERAEATVAEIQAEGGRAVACVADISNWDQAGRLIQTCIDSFGRIDGLVNNAVYYSYGLMQEYDPVGGERAVLVNVLGSLNCMGHAIKPMLAQNSGSIVNVVSGAHLGMVHMGVYGATKGALASMVYTWTLELEGTGVRANGLSPFAATNDDGAQTYGDPEEAAKRQHLLPKPENNSFVVEFLVSDLASDVRGQLVRCDGDEIYLYSHPALLIPSVRRPSWTAEELGRVFQNEFKDRQVRCGVLGQESLPVDLTGGFWARLAEAEKEGAGA
jgi:NAD(P)-dependent dehydrogenase (short-subunit alcohol dehydrogenase family)